MILCRRLGLLALTVWFAASCSNSVSGPSQPAPIFTTTAPAVAEITIQRGASVVFEVEARGPNGEPVQIQFRVNQLIAASSSSYLFSPPDTGRYRIDAVATLGDNSTTHSWTVMVVAPNNAPPLVQLTTSTITVEAGQPIAAEVSAQDTDGTIVGVAIDFDGDGIPEQTAAAGSLQANHTYATPGTYTIRATATDNGGATAALTRAVTVLQPNLVPTGALAADETTGDGPLTVVLSATAADQDGTVEKIEIDPGLDGNWVDVTSLGPLQVSYAFREDRYPTRLRLTDDKGAQVTIDGPAITVFQPINESLSTARITQGNPWFNAFPSFAPAAFANNNDRLHFSVTVRDHSGAPLGNTPVRIVSLRPPLISPNGDFLGEPITIHPSNDGTTDAAGNFSGYVTSNTSGHVYSLLALGSFAFDLRAEAYAGHGVWRPLPQMTRLNFETTVSTQETTGQVQVLPAAACAGVQREIRIRGFGNSVSPNPGQPVTGVYADIRYGTRKLVEGQRPAPGYANWRTGSDGWISLLVQPTDPGNWIIVAWLDGVPLNIPSGLFVQEC